MALQVSLLIWYRGSERFYVTGLGLEAYLSDSWAAGREGSVGLGPV